MWFKLSINGLEFEFQIKNYVPSSEGSWDIQWCDISFLFRFSDIIDISGRSQSMLSCEVENLESKIDDLINEKLSKRETLYTLESDFAFEFIPSCELNNDEYTLELSNQEEPYDGIMKWKVYLYDCYGLTNHYFSATLQRDDLKIFRDYLRLVMGKLNKNSPEIKNYVNSGIIYGQI